MMPPYHEGLYDMTYDPSEQLNIMEQELTIAELLLEELSE